MHLVRLWMMGIVMQLIVRWMIQIEKLNMATFLETNLVVAFHQFLLIPMMDLVELEAMRQLCFAYKIFSKTIIYL